MTSFLGLLDNEYALLIIIVRLMELAGYVCYYGDDVSFYGAMLPSNIDRKSRVSMLYQINVILSQFLLDHL